MREEVADVRGQSNDVAARVATAEAAQRRPAAPPSAPRTEKGPEASLQPECVVAWVAQCSPADQRRLAQLLLPHLRPALSDAIRDEVQHQLRAVRTEHREELREIEGRLRAYVEAEEAVVDAQQNAASQRRSGGAGSPAQPAESSAPLWAGFSSGDAFNAHLRATARAVLVEEDDRRYSLANDNERRHEMRVRELQRHWQATLVEAQHTWKAEWRSMLHAAEEAWTRQAQAPLQQHADLLQKIVTTLTRDVTHLHERQDAQAASVQESLHKEREMRQREQAKFAERVEQSVRQLLPREVESACARYHVQRERTAATELCGTRATHGSSGSGASPLLPPTASAQLTAEELRLSVVQPALEHMRRLLASHQEMMDAVVEGRCRRAEGVMEGSRHVWLQNVTELRGKVSSLRSDVRGAFNELCSNLNVASPAL
ncbi:hypothetical protein ABB37_07912 [Leptomonas pyrrhocoris]|uniref:Uncharacterized protein n=1 Tax=Leptomonas pyrrhocoris TaxID=157538 RepID=A0A0M9FU57_LEPPY|nr:hypothetical protein ABB37_07912 [Leptomonas pyrrhocoris]KPA76145.1 hypothetical protein ABB37_07912 [Leptomonas pyrrhocoris]|eukprot:XP_015654584.1 hypothetical protein ABB37_07912 [Leptomonas pyrrhocoris]